METKKVKVIALVLAIFMMLSAAVLVGCEDKKTDETKAATRPAETAAATETQTPTQGTEAPVQSDTQAPADTETLTQNDDSQQDGGQTQVDEDGYLSEQEALANVRKLAGTGAQILSYYKGYAPDGAAAWVVTVSPITRDSSDKTVTYYSGYLFCYADTDAQNDDGYEYDDASPVEEDGYLSQQEAIANVRKLAGTGAQIIDYYKGYTPDGLSAWVVTVLPVSASDDSGTVTYYSGYLFCYQAD